MYCSAANKKGLGGPLEGILSTPSQKLFSVSSSSVYWLLIEGIVAFCLGLSFGASLVSAQVKFFFICLALRDRAIVTSLVRK